MQAPNFLKHSTCSLNSHSTAYSTRALGLDTRVFAGPAGHDVPHIPRCTAPLSLRCTHSRWFGDYGIVDGADDFLALPVVSYNNKQIHMDLLDTLLPPRWQRRMHHFGNGFTAIVLVCATVIFAIKARTMSLEGDTTAVLHIPLDLLAYVTVLMALLYAIVHTIKCFSAPITQERSANV